MLSRRRPRGHEDDEERYRKRPSQQSPSFPSYLDDPNLPERIRILCEIVAKDSSPSIESALDSAGVSVSAEDVELVLKLSYSHPVSALKFFLWSGPQLLHRHSPYAWNLVVDLLGKNQHFDAMWEAVSSMLSERLISLATFASIFSSYLAARRPEDALTAFLSMDRYSVPCDVTALNTLLSAACRHSQTPRAREFLARARIPPDADSYAIILEGCENEGDPVSALAVFSEMVGFFGWDPDNVPAYDSFLCAIVRGPGGVREALKHLEILRERGCPPGIKFFRAAIDEAVRAVDLDGGSALWHVMGSIRCRPDANMYHSMLWLLCYSGQVDDAFDMLDRMVWHDVFPDAETYNLMLQCMLKGRKLRDAGMVFKEMIKNGFLPSPENCSLAFKTFSDAGHSDMLRKVWRCMLDNELESLELWGNNLIVRLWELDMLPEACKYAEEMSEKGIKVSSATLSMLRSNLVKLAPQSNSDLVGFGGERPPSPETLDNGKMMAAMLRRLQGIQQQGGLDTEISGMSEMVNPEGEKANQSPSNVVGGTPQPTLEQRRAFYFSTFRDAKVADFKGECDPTEAEGWIMKLTKTFSMIGTPSDFHVLFATYHLVGDADRWWAASRREMKQPWQWEQFVRLFSEQYYPACSEEMKRNGNQQQKQGRRTRPVKAAQTSREQQLRQQKQGRRNRGVKAAQTSREQQLRQRKQGRRTRAVKTAQTSGGQESETCYLCGETGHYRRECPKRQKNQTVSANVSQQ